MTAARNTRGVTYLGISPGAKVGTDMVQEITRSFSTFTLESRPQTPSNVGIQFGNGILSHIVEENLIAETGRQ